ncbi:MAG TPA: DUF192 domain-containing protein [Sphingomonas sp.]|nr:DUF192 domain-containing protein [Sphingomonas sp.]
MNPRIQAALAAAILTIPAACTGGNAAASAANEATAAKTMPVTITSAATGAHRFEVEIAKTPAEQERGLMFRTDIPKDGGMLFWPYPADGGPPREASFWMKNTPSALDIIYIRPDHTIARIAENTTPYSTTPITSGEPVSAVLELRGGRTAELGIGEDDKVSWPGAEK